MEWLGKNKEKFVSGLFYIGLTIELLLVIVDKSVLTNPPEGIIFRITFVLFALKICFTRYSVKEWIWIIAGCVLGAVAYFVTEENVVLRMMVFIASMKGMELKRVIRYVFRVTLTGCLLIVILSLAGIMGDISRTGEFREGLFETRYTFGMGHPNAFHCMFFMLVLLCLYHFRERARILLPLILFCANWGLFQFTGSKTGFGITALAITAACILGLSRRMQASSWIYLLGIIIWIGCIILSLLAARYAQYVLWGPYFLERLNNLLSGRMGNLYWDSEAHAGAMISWTLFSDPSHFTYYFDMGWVRMFYWFGIIPGIIFSLLHILLIAECRRKKDYMGLLLIVSLSAYTIMEAHIISVYLARNYILLLFGAYWSDMLGAGNRKAYYLYQWKSLLKKEQV